MPTRTELQNHLHDLLLVSKIKDYCPNGLQIEGGISIQKIAFGVTSSLEFIEKALSWGADTLICHHGYFWKSEPLPLIGMKKKRIETILKHNLNLFVYHLPLDQHLLLSNNTGIAKALLFSHFEACLWAPYVFKTTHPTSQNLQDIKNLIEKNINPSFISYDFKNPVQKIAWSSGEGAFEFENAILNENIDLFITGSLNEQALHVAQEYGVSFIACGHHATETFGVKLLQEYLQKQYPQIETLFINIPNPA